MPKIKIAAPAKINLTLKVGKKRDDGFHPIESTMAAINLFDYIDIETYGLNNIAACPKIEITSNSSEIPLDNSNIAHKACELFFKTLLQTKKVEFLLPEKIYINIEKNIPVCAGLAGGSTDASAVLFGLNKIYKVFSEKEINMLCAQLGSDLNFCIYGGMKLCKGRGEILEDIEFREIPITLIKPLNLKISAKEAYQRFDELGDKVSNLPNDLEFALLPYYEELRYLHGFNFQMSGSGPTFFAQNAYVEPNAAKKLKNDYLIIENLKTIKNGICCI